MPERTFSSPGEIALLDRSTGRVLAVARSRRGALAKYARAVGMEPTELTRNPGIEVGRISERLSLELEVSGDQNLHARSVDGAIVSEQEWAEMAVFDTAKVLLVEARADVAVYAILFRADLMAVALRGPAVGNVVVVVNGCDFSAEFDYRGRSFSVHSRELPEGRPTVDVNERPETAAVILLSWWSWTAKGDAPQLS